MLDILSKKSENEDMEKSNSPYFKVVNVGTGKEFRVQASNYTNAAIVALFQLGWQVLLTPEKSLASNVKTK